MSQFPVTRGDTGGLTRPISMGPAAPMGPQPPGGFGASPAQNPINSKIGYRGQQGIGTRGGGYDASCESKRGAATGGYEGKKFIQKAIKRPGQLHRDLGVPQGEKIPKSKIRAAESRGGKVGQRARFAETLSHLRKK